MDEVIRENRIKMCAMADMLDGRWFYVPAYQRGYRWREKQVRELLDDLYTFALKGGGSVYCLQPLVVKPLPQEKRCKLDSPEAKVPAGAAVWEVIDGQQRLTAMYILYRLLLNEDGDRVDALQSMGRKLYGIFYETRPESAGFLGKISGDTRRSKIKNIDEDHIWRTYQEIRRWMEDDVEGAGKIRRQCGCEGDAASAGDVLFDLLNATEIDGAAGRGVVRFVWYELEAGGGTESVQEFRRLNTGKIPLTAAELVKALLLSRNHDFGDGTDGTADEGRLYVQEMALQWEQMENALHNPEFWYFISRDTSSAHKRMGTLLRLAAGLDGQASEQDVFGYYQEKLAGKTGGDLLDAVKAAWEEVVKAFRVLEHWYAGHPDFSCKDWHTCHSVYNWIGFLVHAPAGGSSVYSLYKDWLRLKERDPFLKLLKMKAARVVRSQDYVKHAPKGAPDELVLDSLDYKAATHVRTLLLFLNVRLCDCERVGRFPFERYVGVSWEIEHVDSLTPLEELSKNPEECAKMLALNKEGTWMPEGVRQKVEEAQADYGDRDALKVLYDAYANKNADMRNGIGNLTLLEDKINRSYGNAFFGRKRAIILEKVREGRYVPQATQLVFTKSFTDSPRDLLCWSFETDGMAYRQFIINQLEAFNKEVGV